ncbi:MAG: S26 family signal peptidase [Capsulimonadaceae bacterium]
MQDAPTTTCRVTADDLRALRKREWAVLGTLLVLVLVAFYNVRRVVIHGRSMEPTFHSGQSVLAWTSVPRDSLQVGDVIVFNADDGDDLIKRIVFVQNAAGTALPPTQIWTPKGPRSFIRLFAVYELGEKLHWQPKPQPDERIFVMGDNFEHSEDSRDFGPISARQVIGKVIF